MALEILQGNMLTRVGTDLNRRTQISAGFALLRRGFVGLGYKSGDITEDQVRDILIDRDIEDEVIDYGPGSELIYDPLQGIVTITPHSVTMPLSPQENRIFALLSKKPYRYQRSRDLFTQENLGSDNFEDWFRIFRVHTLGIRNKLGRNSIGDPYIRSAKSHGYAMFPGIIDSTRSTQEGDPATGERAIPIGMAAIEKGMAGVMGNDLTTTEILLALMEPDEELTFLGMTYWPRQATVITTGNGVTHLRPRVNQFLLRMACEPEQFIRANTLGEDIFGIGWIDKPDNPTIRYYIGQLRNAIGDRGRKPRLIRSREHFGYGLFPDPSVMPNIGL